MVLDLRIPLRNSSRFRTSSFSLFCFLIAHKIDLRLFLPTKSEIRLWEILAFTLKIKISDSKCFAIERFFAKEDYSIFRGHKENFNLVFITSYFFIVGHNMLFRQSSIWQIASFCSKCSLYFHTKSQFEN